MQQSSEGLSEAGRCAVRIAQSHGGWQEACFLSHGALYRLLEYSHSLGAGFPQNEWSKKESKTEAAVQCLLWSGLWSHILSLQLYSVLQTWVAQTSPGSRGRGVGPHLLKEDIKRICRHILKLSMFNGRGIILMRVKRKKLKMSNLKRISWQLKNLRCVVAHQ